MKEHDLNGYWILFFILRSKWFAQLRCVLSYLLSGLLTDCGKLWCFIVLWREGTVKSPLELSEEEWNQSFRTNLTGTWLVSKSVCKRMRDAQRKGSIINIASIAGFNRGQLPGGAAYASSKAGVNMLTKVNHNYSAFDFSWLKKSTKASQPSLNFSLPHWISLLFHIEFLYTSLCSYRWFVEWEYSIWTQIMKSIVLDFYCSDIYLIKTQNYTCFNCSMLIMLKF